MPKIALFSKKALEKKKKKTFRAFRRLGALSSDTAVLLSPTVTTLTTF